MSSTAPESRERLLERQLDATLPQAKAAHAAGHALGLPGGTDITVALLPAIHALKQQRDELLAALECVDRELTNMQPHIPQACYPNKQGFIDDYVDVVLVLARTLIANAKAAQAGEGE